MKRASSGRGSLQVPGVLKPRNGDFTPNSRQSAGQPARRSYIPKMGQGGSAQRISNRMARRSAENNVMRSTLTFSRFTPTRSNTPALAPLSANRMSIDSARNSGIGTSTRKDPRYLSDPAHKTQCINKILDFLRNGHQSQYSRRTLLTPSTNDFKNIFNFIFKHFEPGYMLPTRFEEEIPKLLKKLYCPVQLTKSSFVTVGSPHTWPAILTALAFLVDIIHCDSIMSQEPSSFPSDLDDDDDGVSRRLECCIDLYKCTDEEEINSCLEVYCEKIKADEGLSEREMMTVQEEIEEAERALASLPNTAEELKQLQQCYLQYSDDLVKLKTYVQDLQVAIQNKTAMENIAKQRIEELNAEEIKIHEEVKHLKRLQEQQKYSNTALIHLKNHSQEAGKEIEFQEDVGKDLSGQVWNMELEVSKIQLSLRNSLLLFEDFTEKLGIKADLSYENGSIEGLNFHYDDAMYKLMAHKKTAKKATSQAQDKVWETDQDFEKAKGMWQEVVIQHKKLETKMRHTEEEQEVTREEMAREEQLRLEESDLLHQKIMEARKTNKKPIYHMHQIQETMDNKKLEVESYKKKEEMCLQEGHQFQRKLFQEKLQSEKFKKNMIVEHTSRINTACDELLKWLELQHMD